MERKLRTDPLQHIALVTAPRRAKLLRVVTEPLEGMCKTASVTTAWTPDIHALDHFVTKKALAHPHTASLTGSVRTSCVSLLDNCRAVAVRGGNALDRFTTLRARLV